MFSLSHSFVIEGTTSGVSVHDNTENTTVITFEEKTNFDNLSVNGHSASTFLRAIYRVILLLLFNVSVTDCLNHKCAITTRLE